MLGFNSFMMLEKFIYSFALTLHFSESESLVKKGCLFWALAGF